MSHWNGRKVTQTPLKINPITFPAVEIIENVANAVAQLDFGWVSMMRRLYGVADADESSEKMEYKSPIPAALFVNRSKRRFTEIRAKLRTMIGFLLWNRSVAIPQNIEAGIVTPLKAVTIRPTYTVPTDCP